MINIAQANIPNITPDITVTKEQSIQLLLSSIAMNELAFSHLINAEAEKLHAFVTFAQETACVYTKDFIEINQAVTSLLEEITMGQWLGLKRLDRTISLIKRSHDSCNENIEEYEE